MGDNQQGHRSHLRLPGVGGLPSVGSFGVGGFVSDRLTDVVSLLSALPEIGSTLRSINTHIINLDSEVTLMLQGVSRLEGDVDRLRREIEQLRADISSVNVHVEAIGGQIESMEPNIESIGRVAGLLPRNRRKHRNTSAARLNAGAGPTTDDQLDTADSDFRELEGDDAATDLAYAARRLVEAAEAASVAAHPADPSQEQGFVPPYGSLQ